MKAIWAIGMMSGTSLDGVDAALLKTDGEQIESLGPHITLPYDAAMQQLLKGVMKDTGEITEAEQALTQAHIKAVEKLVDQWDKPLSEVAVIGFHGQTIWHKPEEGKTCQIGDAALLARETGCDVVSDFRSRDMEQGGQGAPLVPLYHAALAADWSKPLAFLNLGGIGNVTWIGRDGDIIAFDTGPANVLINEWMSRHFGSPFDEAGATALKGKIDNAALQQMLRHHYFAKPIPKSADRHDFDACLPVGLSLEDGAATLAEFTAASVEKSLAHLPESPREWIVCGGGRHNQAIMQALQRRLGKVIPIEDKGLNGDAIEAQAFAFLAVRSMRGLPLTLPSTTGVRRAETGGVFFRASAVSGS